MTSLFQVGLSAEFKTEATELLEPILREQFDPRPQITYELLPDLKPEVTSAQPQVLTSEFGHSSASYPIETLQLGLSPAEPEPHQGMQGKRALFLDRQATGNVQVELTGV